MTTLRVSHAPLGRALRLEDRIVELFGSRLRAIDHAHWPSHQLGALGAVAQVLVDAPEAPIDTVRVR
jgi:hypothetical protein